MEQSPSKNLTVPQLVKIFPCCGLPGLPPKNPLWRHDTLGSACRMGVPERGGGNGSGLLPELPCCCNLSHRKETPTRITNYTLLLIMK